VIRDLSADLPALRSVFKDLTEARLATVDPDGGPHVAPAWFVWREDAIYLSTRRGGRSWLNGELDPRVSAILDRGRDWLDLSGVILEGRAEMLLATDPQMRSAMSDWHQKYRVLLTGEGFEHLARSIPDLGFLRLEPTHLESWDHRAT
jgi:nitroimidazol reductase NimA-like FMN-containing flavoprotein (pyridoxamine 5'-phosphate oxidase superfamily)